MTREEAIEIEFKSAVGWASHMPETEIRRAAAETIDCYLALGMLKLDEKPFDLVAHLTGHCRLPRMHGGDCEKMSKEEAERIVDVVNSAGLRIVEK